MIDRSITLKRLSINLVEAVSHYNTTFINPNACNRALKLTDKLRDSDNMYGGLSL